MNLTPATKVHDLIEEYPFLLDFLAGYNPKFGLLKNKAMRATMGRMAKLSMVAEMGGISLETLISDIAAEIAKQTGEKVETDIAGVKPQDDSDKLDRLKNIIISLHRGEEFAKVKAEFDTLMSEIDPTQIAAMEEQLIRDGMPAEEIQRLCDLHVSMFKGILDKHDEIKAPPGHPVHTYMEENIRFTEIVSAFDKIVKAVSSGDTSDGLFESLKDVLSRLSLLDTHYVRKENQLFPYLEKHGVTGPSQVMWGIHDEIRGMLKKISAAVDSMDISVLSETGPALSRAVIEMIYKENSILFPMAVDTLSDKEWLEIRKGEDEVGYAFVKPGGEWPEERSAGEPVAHEEKPENLLKLDTGALTVDQVNLLLKHLPVEVSFVDENNVVRYYSDTKDRIFPRSPGVIGRTVQNCHPPKSVHIVNRILESFRSGEKDYADFWIRMHGRMILIRYFAVRDSESTYKGTIEVTQDITDIKSLEGEQRLLDWDDAN